MKIGSLIEIKLIWDTDRQEVKIIEKNLKIVSFFFIDNIIQLYLCFKKYSSF